MSSNRAVVSPIRRPTSRVKFAKLKFILLYTEYRSFGTRETRTKRLFRVIGLLVLLTYLIVIVCVSILKLCPFERDINSKADFNV